MYNTILNPTRLFQFATYKSRTKLCTNISALKVWNLSLKNGRNRTKMFKSPDIEYDDPNAYGSLYRKYWSNCEIS